MRGNLHPRPRFSAKAFLAGAAFLASAAAPTFSTARAQEAPEDMAMAIPRLSPEGHSGVALPRPLPSDVARRIRTAFANPAAPLDGLSDNPLLGHILAERLLSAPQRAPADQLRDWLSHFATLPDATAIHSLLCTKLPRPALAPPSPDLAPFVAAPFGDDIETSEKILPRNLALDRTVQDAGPRRPIRPCAAHHHAQPGFERPIRRIAPRRGRPRHVQPRSGRRRPRPRTSCRYAGPRRHRPRALGRPASPPGGSNGSTSPAPCSTPPTAHR